MPFQQQLTFENLRTNISNSINESCQTQDTVISQIAEEVKHIQTATVEPGVEIVRGSATIIDTTIKNSVRLECDASLVIKGIFVGAFRSNASIHQAAHTTINLLVNEIARSVFKYKIDAKQMINGLLSASILVAEEQKLNESELCLVRLVVMRDILIAAKEIDPDFLELIKTYIPKEYDELLKERNKESQNA